MSFHANPSDTGIAVSDARRLNQCFDQLVARLASDPEAKLPDWLDRDILPLSNRRLLKGDGEIADVVNHQRRMQELATAKLTRLISEGALVLWVRNADGEDRVDSSQLRQINHATVATGRHCPQDHFSPLGDMPLWIKNADWDQALEHHLGLSPPPRISRNPGRPNARNEAIAIHIERRKNRTTAKSHKREAEEIYEELSRRHKRAPKLTSASIAKALQEWRRTQAINENEK